MHNATPEEWRPIPGYETGYAVSDRGRVRNARNGRILDGWRNAKGYRMVVLGGRGRKQRYVHHLVAEAFIGPRPPGQEVRHYPDRNPANNALVNLAYGTISRNALDSIEHGTHFQASKTHCSKGNHELTPENTYLKSGGGRECRTCSRESKRRYKKRQKIARQALISSQTVTCKSAS